jgi:hypothetical protein
VGKVEVREMGPERIHVNEESVYVCSDVAPDSFSLRGVLIVPVSSRKKEIGEPDSG